jgi:hypothetical protein
MATDRPMTFLLTVSVVINSSDGTRSDALSHLEQMLNLHGLAGVQMAALEPVQVMVQRSDVVLALTNDQAAIARQAAL